MRPRGILRGRVFSDLISILFSYILGNELKIAQISHGDNLFYIFQNLDQKRW